MAFWIKKNQQEKIEVIKEDQSPKKKKDDKKAPQPKRIDNLRIPQQLNIILRSIGTNREYSLQTKDLSATGAFVVCPNHSAYPFSQSTILDSVVELMGQNTSESIKVRFLAKIARIVEYSPDNPSHPAGFGIRIIQITPEQKHVLENYIARHGTAETHVAPNILRKTELSKAS